MYSRNPVRAVEAWSRPESRFLAPIGDRNAITFGDRQKVCPPSMERSTGSPIRDNFCSMCRGLLVFDVSESGNLSETR